MITEALTPSQFGACDTQEKLRRTDGVGVEWLISDGLVPYPKALAAMKARAESPSSSSRVKPQI